MFSVANSTPNLNAQQPHGDDRQGHPNTDLQGQPHLVATIDGEQLPVRPADLTNDSLRSELQNRCEQAGVPAVFTVVDFFGWPDAPRFLLLQLLRDLGGQACLRFDGDANQHSSPFEAIVANLVGPNDAQRCLAGQRAAMEAAVLFFPEDGWNIAANSITTRLRAVGLGNVLPQSIGRGIRNVAGQVAEREAFNPAEAARDFHCWIRSQQLSQQADQEDDSPHEPSSDPDGELPTNDPALRYFQQDFYVWHGTRWARLEDKELEAMVIRFLQRDDQLTVTTQMVGNVIANLRGQVLLPGWDMQMPIWIESEDPLQTGHPRLIVFENGMIDLQEAFNGNEPRCYPHDPCYFTTVQLPYVYAPEEGCPLWLETIAEIFPCEEDGDNRIAVLQEFMGLTLFHGDTMYDKFLICVGKGANGKSTIMRTWNDMLGSDNVTHVPLDALNKDFRLEQMRAKLANIATDMQRMDRVEEGRLKELTSGEPIQVDRKHKAPITMVPTARLIFATNELPPINDKSDGIWRRMMAMPFNVQFTGEQIDLHRAARLRDELPGIFNWALEGALRLYRQGRFTSCSVCERCASEHRHHSDPFRQFIDEEVVLGRQLVTECGELYQAYQDFCQLNGRKPRASTEFGKQLLDLPRVTKVRSGAGNRPYVYEGVGLSRSVAFRAALPSPEVPDSIARRMTGQPPSNN